MKDPESASPASRQIRSFHLILGFILASFMVCFVAFGCMVYVEISDLRSQVREIKEIDMLKFPDSPKEVYYGDAQDDVSGIR
jgi:hypothetical protein